MLCSAACRRAARSERNICSTNKHTGRSAHSCSRARYTLHLRKRLLISMSPLSHNTRLCCLYVPILSSNGGIFTNGPNVDIRRNSFGIIPSLSFGDSQHSHGAEIHHSGGRDTNISTSGGRKMAQNAIQPRDGDTAAITPTAK